MTPVNGVGTSSAAASATPAANTQNLAAYRPYVAEAKQVFASELAPIDASWILAVIMVETEIGTNVHNSSSNGIGVMQIVPGTAVEMLANMTDTELKALTSHGFSSALITQIKSVKTLEDACSHCATKAEQNSKQAQYKTAFRTAEAMAKTELKKPKQNIIIGSYIIAHLYHENDHSISRAIANYNPGNSHYYSRVSLAKKRI